MMASRVLIVAPENDAHALAVASALETYGGDSWILDIQDFPALVSASATLSPTCLTATCDREADALDLAGVTSIWWRRAWPARPPAVYTGLQHAGFVQVECDHFIEGVLWSLGAFLVNDPAAEYLASRKVVQMRTASRVGLHLPETLITTKPMDAWHFIHEFRPVVFKRVGASSGPASITTVADFTSADELASITTCPTIFQRYITGNGDARVIAVGEELWAIHIESQAGSSPNDSRFDLTVPHRAIEVPRAVATGVKALMRGLRLAFGAVDFRIDSEGCWWFLEVNPGGQFLYLEEKTGLRIVDSVARLLMNPPSLPGESAPAYG